MTLDRIREKLGGIVRKLRSAESDGAAASSPASAPASRRESRDRSPDPTDSGEASRSESGSGSSRSTDARERTGSDGPADSTETEPGGTPDSDETPDSQEVPDGTPDSKDSPDEPTREDLLGEIERLTDELGKIPSAGEMQEHGSFGPQRYYSTFGSWNDAIDAAEVDLEAELIEDIRRVGDELGKRPTGSEVDEHGRYMSSRARHYFDTWEDAVDAAGVDPVDDEELLAELRRLDDELDGLPLSTEMRDRGRFSVQRYLERFGSWDDALERAGIDKRARLEAELRRVAREVGGRPTTAQMNEIGRCSHGYVSDEYGTWGDALAAAGVENGPPSAAESTEPESDETGETDESSTAVPDGLARSAFETSWESIPDNDRLDGQLLVRVEHVRTPREDRKTHVLTVRDRHGEECSFDVWTTHDLDYEWEEGHWYAVTDARGSAWQTDDGETRKRLSSTRALDVVDLGPDFDPAAVDPDEVEPAETDRGSGGDRGVDTVDDPDETDGVGDTEDTDDGDGAGGAGHVDDTDDTEGELFDDIVSEFDDL